MGRLNFRSAYNYWMVENKKKECCGSCFWETDEPPFCENPDLKGIPKYHCRGNDQHHWKEKVPSTEK